jgi:hypothetical protein
MGGGADPNVRHLRETHPAQRTETPGSCCQRYTRQNCLISRTVGLC